MYELVNVEKTSKKYPNSFLGKPTTEEIKQLQIGNLVSLAFQEGEGNNSVLERKYVRITKVTKGTNDNEFEGFLDQNIYPNNPYIVSESQLKTVKEGDNVRFKTKHICLISVV